MDEHTRQEMRKAYAVILNGKECLHEYRKKIEQAEAENASADVVKYEREMMVVEADVKAARKKVFALERENKNTVVEVTDHALVRYFERVLGMDTEAMKATIIADLRESGATHKGRFPLSTSAYAVVENGVVVTITLKK